MKKKILSLVLSVLLLISCTLGVLFVGAKAETPTVIYTACDYTEEGKEHFIDITTALADAAAKSGQWKADDILEIRFSGTQSGAGAQDGLLFAQKTIWREDGTKLPITIRGIDTSKSRDALIDLDHAGGWYACANDYTFVNLTMPIGTWGVTFYAGSGNVKFEECHLSTVSSRIMVPDAASQQQVIRLSEEVSDRICDLYDVDLLPVGDAWEEVVNDTTSPFHSEQYGHLLRAMANKGTLYGDWTHDGDVGGGQYLNACIVFEVVTHQSCVGIDWEPSYGLVNPDMSFKALRELAHRTVVNHYGEEYFNETWTDIGNDGVFNLLFPGSSTCYYFADEVASLGYHAGLDMNVYNPYISSLKINPQWEKIQTAAEEYQLRVWKDTGSGAKLTTTAKQSLQNIVPLKEWDAAFIYTGSSQFDDYGLKATDYPTNLNKIMVDMSGAEGTYAFLRENCPEGTKMFWFQPPPAPIGAFGTSTASLNGYIFADTCTDAVFAGWPALAEGETVKTSITFGNNVVYEDPTTEGRGIIRVAASGYHPDETFAKLTSDTAKEVKFMDGGLEDTPDIRPVDTEPTFYIDGENARAYNVAAKIGSSPCDATIVLKKGGVQRIGGDNYTVQSTANGLDGQEENFYGDLRVVINGGTVAESVVMTWDAIVVGNLELHIEKTGKENINILGNVSGNMGNNTMGRCTGTSTTYIKGANIVGEVKLGGSNQGNVNNTMENCTVGGIFIGSYTNQPVTITNKLKNVTFLGTGDSYLGTNGDALTNVVNTIENCSFAGNVFGGNKSGYVRGSITNTVKNSTFAKNFVGGNYKSVIAGSVINSFTGGSVTGAYYGGTQSTSDRSDTIGVQIKNTIKGTAFSTGFLYMGNQFATFAANDTVSFRIENEISDVTAPNSRYFGASSDSAVESVKNTFGGINNLRNSYGGSNNQTVGKVENHYRGKMLTGAFSGCNNANLGSVVNYIEQGADLATFYGGLNSINTQTYTMGSVTNYVYGGSVETFYGAGRGGTVTSVTNYVGDPSGKSVPRIGAFYGGCNDSAVITDVTTEIKGGIFEGVVAPGCYKTSSTSKVINTPVFDLIVGEGYLAFLGETTIPSLKGEGTILVGKDASVTVTSAAEGSVAIEQIDLWQDKTYFTDNSGNLTLSVLDNVPGSASVSGNTVVGTLPTEQPIAPVAARLVLDTRVGVKFYFEKADITETFSYRILLGDKEIAQGDFNSFTEEDGYYVLFFGGIGLSDFMTEFSIQSENYYDSNKDNYNTVVKLAELGAQNCELYKEKQLFYAIADLGRVAKEPASAVHNLGYYRVKTQSEGSGAEEGALLTFTGKNLVMSDALGIRLYGEALSAEDVKEMTIYVGGENVTSLCEVSLPVLKDGKYEFTVDILFSVSKMNSVSQIKVTDQNGKACLSLSDQVDWIAQAIVDKEPENTLAEQVLIYIQKVDNYLNDYNYITPPSEPGNESEIGGGVDIF